MKNMLYVVCILIGSIGMGCQGTDDCEPSKNVINYNLKNALREDDIDKARRAINKGVQCDTFCIGEHREKFLHLAAKYCDIEMIRLLITEGRASVDVRDGKGRTPLHCLIESWDAGVVDIDTLSGKAGVFIGNGADLNAQDNDGCTILHYAVLKNSPDLIEYLAFYGVLKSVNTKDLSGKTPVDIVEHFPLSEVRTNILNWLYGRRNQANYALRIAIYKRDISKAPEAIREGVQCDTFCIGEHDKKFLHLAVEGYDADMTRLLLTEGMASANVKDKNGNTPLHSVIALHQRGVDPCLLISIIQILFDYGADANAQNNNGYTPLHYAAGKASPKLIKYLKEKGARSSIKDNRGKTAVDILWKVGACPQFEEIWTLLMF